MQNQQEMKLDAEVIEGFVGSVLIRKFNSPTAIPECHREWWNLCCSDTRFVAIAAPRGHAKSTAITHSYILANVLFRFKTFCIIVSDTETQAVQFLGDIKQELLENEAINKLFGIRKFLKYTENDIVVEFNDRQKFRIVAKGAEQSLRGLKWNGQRPNLIVCDDMENDELVMNKDRREKFHRWIYGALLPCLSPEGTVRVVGTVLHMDSFLEQLMPKPWDKRTIATPLKDYTDHKNGLWKAVRYRAHDPEFKNILWGSRFPEANLKALRAEYAARGIPDVYSQEYLNYPLDPTKAYFRRTDFIPMPQQDYEDILEKRKLLTYYIGIDLAISEEERADFSAFLVAGMDQDGVLHVVDGILDRMDSREIIQTILDLNKRYKPEFIAIEKEKITKAIGPYLREAMIKQNQYPIMIEIQPSKDIQLRARSWQGRMRAGTVKFHKGGDWYADYEAQLTTFPRSAKDDYVAACAVLGLALDRMVEAPTKQEVIEEEYEEEVRRAGMDFEFNGRSSTTGY
jgi:predicted phage terminase large subunit-like protein